LARSSFLESCKAFESEAVPTNFSDEQAYQRINQMVAEATKGRIPSLLSEPLNPLTRMVLTNVVHFQGKWVNSFEPSQTRERPFTRLDNAGQSQVPMMTLANHTVRGVVNGKIGKAALEALCLRYENGCSMWFVLPAKNTKDSLQSVENAIFELGFSKFLGSLKDLSKEQKYTSIVIPRCKLVDSVPANEALSSLGMQDGFNEQKALFFRDVPALTNLPIYISKVVHQCNIEIDESGTVASAASAVVMRAKCAVMHQAKLVFNCDRPFICLLVADDPGLVFFVSRVLRL